MTVQTRHWQERITAALSKLPTRETLSSHPWLLPLASRLLQPHLWRLQHEALARGVAVGSFWAFAIPFGQVLVAAAHCTWWRANIPAAAAMTLLTNPLTIGFWLWLAYQLGTWVMGEPADGSLASAANWLSTYGWPTVLGMGLFAVGGAALGYATVKLLWRLNLWHRRRARRSAAPVST